MVVHQHGCGEGSCKSGLTGAYDLHWQALAKAHGPTKDASLNGARLLRKSPAGTKEIPIRLQEMLRAKAEDMAMQSEDILFIPGSRGKYAARSTLSTILTIATGVAIRGY